MNVTLMTADELARGDLSRYQTIITGIRAYDVREDVRKNNARLLEFVRGGGTLIVQYNTGVAAFNNGHYTPYPAELGRERVTEEESPVQVLAPEDKIFRVPNKITADDFNGWIQERGLYFMHSWDEHWEPLLAMHDRGEPPRKGGLLRCYYGRGTYIYTGLSFFRELAGGVPGAVRLFVNLVDDHPSEQSFGPRREARGMNPAHEAAQRGPESGGLRRELGLGGATALNMIDMIGVGPFITIPLMLGAMGGPQAMLGWILGAVFAACDGLVWAELGAAMPGSGGTYRYLREIYGARRLGRMLSFLYVWQLSFSAPLSIASGCVGLAQYAGFVWPSLARAGAGTAIAILCCVAAVGLLYRPIRAVGQLSKLLWTLVAGTVAWVIFAGATHFNAARAFDFPAGAFHPDASFFTGLGAAMLVATYDYWGYYNVCFLGDEVREPSRTIPRAVMLSIAGVAAIYLVMNISVLGVIPWRELTAPSAKPYVISAMMQRVYGTSGGNGGDVAGDADGLCLGFFAAAGLLARALRGGAGWKLLPRICARGPEAALAQRLITGAGRGCVPGLFSAAGGPDRGAGGDSHHAAIPGAGRGFAAAARHAAGFSAPFQNVALSAAGAAGDGRIYIRTGLA